MASTPTFASTFTQTDFELIPPRDSSDDQSDQSSGGYCSSLESRSSSPLFCSGFRHTSDDSESSYASDVEQSRPITRRRFREYISQDEESSGEECSTDDDCSPMAKQPRIQSEEERFIPRTPGRSVSRESTPTRRWRWEREADISCSSENSSDESANDDLPRFDDDSDY